MFTDLDKSFQHMFSSLLWWYVPIHTTASHLAFPKHNFKINSQYQNQAFQCMPHLSATFNFWPVPPTGCKYQLIGDQEQRRRDDSHHRQLFGFVSCTVCDKKRWMKAVVLKVPRAEQGRPSASVVTRFPPIALFGRSGFVPFGCQLVA